MIEGESPTLVRKHGADPFAVVAVHGGPGAAGEMEPLARRLGRTRGVLEPMQTAMTVSRQVDELRSSVESEASRPVVLIGHSWGAWLSWIVAATYPRLVRKLILIGSGPCEEHYVHLIRENRLKRLTPDVQQQFVHADDRPGQMRPRSLAGTTGDRQVLRDTRVPVVALTPSGDRQF
jgi:pimeloyl-ACP methyl ester carboxylesterase